MKKSGTKKTKKGLSDIAAAPVFLDACFLFSSYQDKSLRLWSTVLCTPRGALVPASLSAGEPRLLSHAKSPNAVFEQRTANRQSAVLCHFWSFSSHLVSSKRSRGGEKETRVGVRQGSGAVPKLIMTWGHGMCLSSRRHKEADVLGILKLYHEMTQLGPHSFCMRHTQGRILYFTWKIEWLVPEPSRMKPPLEAPQVELDAQAEHFAMGFFSRYSSFLPRSKDTCVS